MAAKQQSQTRSRTHRTDSTRKTSAKTSSRGGRSHRTSDRANASAGILGDLKDDHKAVKKLLKQLEDSEEAEEQKGLFQLVHQELMVHAKLEEELFYPAYKEAIEAGMGGEEGTEEEEEERALFFEAAEEHASVETLLAKMKATGFGTDEFCAQACVLKEQVEHHADEEEEEMFPAAAKAMGKQMLEQLAVQAEELRPTLMQQYKSP